MEFVYPPKYDRTEYGAGAFEFDPERDLAISPVWMLDAVHTIPPVDPLSINCEWPLPHIHWAYGSDSIFIPRLRGTFVRSVRGSTYVAPLVIEDEDEIKQREKKFAEAMRPYIENYRGLYDDRKAELRKMWSHFKNVDFDKLSDPKLWSYWEDWWEADRRQWEWHFVDMYPGCTIWGLFINVCNELLGIDETSPLFLRLFQGFHNDLLAGDAEMERLAMRGAEYGLTDILTGKPEASEIIPKLEATVNGRTWLREFRDFLDEYGWRAPRVCDFAPKSWREDPSPAFVTIRNYAMAGAAGVLAEARKAAGEERERAEEEALSKVPEARREEFRALLKSAQVAHVFMDEHGFLYDLQAMAHGRHVTMAMGRRMVDHGSFDDPEDIRYLVADEIRLAFMSHLNVRGLVKKRRKLHEQYIKEPKPPAICAPGLSIEQGIGEALSRFIKGGDYVMLLIVIGTLPKVRPELKADLYGVAASPGVAEGPARVAITDEDLKEFRKGEILVCGTSSASWTWVWSLLAAAVADRGGITCHTAIVSREYRIPCVLNVMEGTAKITTGQRIRVDGNTGAVYILS